MAARTPLINALLALLACATLMVPASAAAAGGRHARALAENEGEGKSPRRGACTVAITPPSAAVTGGEGATISGTVSCANPAEAGEQQLTASCHTAGTPGYSPCGAGTSSSDGSFALKTEALTSNTILYVSIPGARSTRVPVEVASQITVSGPPSGAQLLIAGLHARASVRATNTVTFTGSVLPATAGTRVVLQREHGGGSWRAIAFGEVDGEGNYAITHTFLIPGNATVRVIARGHGRLAGASQNLSYAITRNQHSVVSIQTSPETLAFGSSVRITGALAGPLDAPLTLLARTREGAFAPIATTTSEAGGNYSFPAQTPLQSTIYRVRSGHTFSASLLERVSPVLSATISSATVAQGASVTFSGTLTPDATGQTIYLQRESASGLSFQTVQSITVGAGSKYSVEHTLASAGPQTFRIMLPSDSAYEGVVSEPFAVEVTAVP